MAKTLAEQIVDEIESAYQTHTGDNSVTFRFGELSRADRESSRRVVFVRTGGKLEPPKRTGGKWMRNGFEASAARFDKVEQVTAHIYDPDAGNVELIHENLMVAISDALKTAVNVDGDYIWRTEAGGAAHLTRTAKIEQPMTWRLAIPSRAHRLVEINGFTETCNFGSGEFGSAFGRAFKFAGGEDND
jgi:hypothetical protein